MLQKLDYDFTGFEEAVAAVKQNPNCANLDALRIELNNFWSDKECKDVLYSDNLDKMFFGTCVIPVVDDNMVKTILSTDDKIVPNAYYLEIDSKLIDIGVTTRELAAIILHQVGGVVNNGQGIDAIRQCMDTYYPDSGKDLPSLNYNSRVIIGFGVTQALRKWNDIFDVKDENYIADEFVVRCGYGPDLESAVKRILRNTGTIIRQVDNKFIVLQWAIRVYTELKYRRLNVIRSLGQLVRFTGSQLEIREILKLRNMLKDKDLVFEMYQGIHVNESFIDKLLDKMSEAYRTFKYKGMKGFEDDLYEYSMRIDNVDDQDEALMILRQMNLRISVIDDYIIEEGKKISDDERNRWLALKSKYIVLRDKLTTKTTYKDKYLGLFVKTPVVNSRYEA